MMRKFLIAVLFIHILTAVCFAGSIKDYEENQAKIKKHYNTFVETKITDNIGVVTWNYVYLNEFIRSVDNIKHTSNQQERASYLKNLREKLTRNVNKLNDLKKHIEYIELTDELKEYPAMQNVPDLLRTYVNELTLSQTQMLALINGNQVNGSDIRSHEIEAFKAINTLIADFKEMSSKHKLELNSWFYLNVSYSKLQGSLENRAD